MPRLDSWRARALAALAVIAVAAAAVLISRVGDDREPESLCAYFDNTFGLYPDAAVTIRGIRVGTVRMLRPDGGRVRVGMSLDDRTLPADVGAAVVNSSILADRRVELVRAGYHGGPTFPAGQCIPQDRTRVPVSASETLGSFAKLIRQLTAPDGAGLAPLAALLHSADRELGGAGVELNAGLRDLAALMSAPDTFMNDVGRLLDTSAELGSFVNAEWADIKTTLSTFGPGLGLIEHLLELTKVVVGKLADAIGPLNRLFTQHFPYLMEVLNSSVPVIALVRTRTEQSKDLLDRVPGVIRMLRAMLAAPGGVALAYRPPTVAGTPPATAPGLLLWALRGTR
jgi:virulence factor Mce-like protein